MKNILNVFLVLIFAGSSVFAQKRYIKKADHLIRKGEFHKAIPYLHLALNKKATNASASYKLGTCYAEANDVGSALTFYQHAWDMDSAAHKDMNLKIAELYHRLNRFEEAKKYYELQLSFGDSVIYIENQIAQCNNGIEVLKQDTAIVWVKNLGPFVNTRYPEYVPKFDSSFTTMMYTTRRPRKKLDHHKFAAYFHDLHEEIFSAQKDSVENIWHEASDTKGVQYRFHDANISTSPDGNELYLYQSKNGGDIYVSKRKGKSWSKPEPIKGINSKSYEPSFCFTDDYQKIIFSSDRPGGQGSLDLYISTKGTDGWNTPTNIENLNTSFDEDGPYIFGEYLYFSSRGPNSIGFHDIFKSKINPDGSFGTPERLPYPINSGAEDIFYTEKSDHKFSYFSSNRNGGQGGMDLWEIDLDPPFKAEVLRKREEEKLRDSLISLYNNGTLIHKDSCKTEPPVASNDLLNMKEGAPQILKGHIFDLITSESLSAELTITDLATNQVVKKVNTDKATGSFAVEVVSGKIYRINVESSNYNRHIEDFIVRTNDKKEVQPKEIGLEKTVGGSVFSLGWQFFDFDKSVLKFEAIKELDNLVNVMQQIADMRVLLEGHTDSDGSDEYNVVLAKKRVNAVKDYLVKKGIEASRLEVKSYGESRPLYDNNNPKLKKYNRRVEVRIIN